MFWKKSRVIYIDIRWLIIKIAIAVLAVFSAITYWQWTKVYLVEFYSPELESQWKVTDPFIIRKICTELKKSTRVKAKNSLPGGKILKLKSKMETREYLFTESGYLLDTKDNIIIKPSLNLTSYMDMADSELRKRSPFGELLNWEHVKQIFQTGCVAAVTDIDSGLKFAVKRTGGYSHADVEPKSEKDAAVVRRLYESKMVWKRRAVVIDTGGRKIAASLTGAPHGRGIIKDNDFTGKIGLYFSGKDKAGGANLSHRVMIWKAAGKTRQQLRRLTLEETIMVLFTALDQRDKKTLSIILSEPDKLKHYHVNEIIGVTVTRMRKINVSQYNVTMSLSLRNGPYNEPRLVKISFKKDKTGIYLANPVFLKEVLKK